ncbi:hypothetical protein ES707_03383 [subsurface metagenome]
MRIKLVYRDFNASLLGNVSGFRSYGDVEPIQIDKLKRKDLEGDLLFTNIDSMMPPKPNTVFEISSKGDATLWRLGQYDGLSSVLRNIKLATILDTCLYRWLKEKKQSWGKIKLVPDGLHYDLFQPKAREEVGIFSVLAPKMMSGINLIKTVNYIHSRGYTAIRFIAVASKKVPYSIRGIEMLRPRPFYKMPNLYQANIILNVDEENLDTANNTFLSSIPLITLRECVGDLQTVHMKYLTKMRGDFGQSVDWFDEQWNDKYGSGDHYLKGDSIKELGDHIIHLYENPDEEKELALKGRKWAETLNYTWNDKIDLIMRNF